MNLNYAISTLFTLAIIVFILRLRGQAPSSKRDYPSSNQRHANQRQISQRSGSPVIRRADGNAFDPNMHNDDHSDLGTPVYTDEVDRKSKWVNAVLVSILIVLLIAVGYYFMEYSIYRNLLE
ncbi:MAG: hypothetical protein LBC69_01420 [Eubacteriaceae bacterium]|nr:hypothetical protein [Eubacteriaceae bacterium]